MICQLYKMRIQYPLQVPFWNYCIGELKAMDGVNIDNIEAKVKKLAKRYVKEKLSG